MSKLVQGDKAPNFTLRDQDGNEVRLADYEGEKLVLFFYPKANTPGCTKQACALRDAREDLQAIGTKVVGISPDGENAQKKFDGKHGFGYPLLCDEDHAVADAYGVWGEKSMYGRKYMGIIRSAFLIDAQGTIQQAWYKISPAKTVPSVLEALEN